MTAVDRSRPASPAELQRLSDTGGRGWVGPRPADHIPDDDEEFAGDAAALLGLADMSPLEYDRIRKSEARRLGVRPATLDREVGRLRSDDFPDREAGRLTDPVPWSDPVNGAGLLDRLAATIGKYVVVPPMAAEATALWIMHAHAHPVSNISPLLAVTSPTPECGKTTLLTLIGALVPRPLPASNITAAALFRAIEKWRPTLVIDEADTFLKDSDELRGVVNSGHNRANAFVIRTCGEDHEPQSFSTWAPKVIALIGRLPPTLDSRSIHVELRRLAAGETVQPLRGDRLQHLEPFCRMAWRWAQDHVVQLTAADPVLPASLRGRTADNWRPLIAIADVAGGDWPLKARKAAEALSAGRSEQSVGVILLDDIRVLFAEKDADRLTSAEIVAALGAREDRPWAEWRGEKPMTARQLARVLEPFGVRPATIRRPVGTAKGYLRDDFADAFRRYPAASVTPSQASKTAASGQSASVTFAARCDGSNLSGAAENGRCDVVTDRSAEAAAVMTDTSDAADERQAAFDERAGIMEFDGGLPRGEAQERAKEEIDALRQVIAAKGSDV